MGISAVVTARQFHPFAAPRKGEGFRFPHECGTNSASTRVPRDDEGGEPGKTASSVEHWHEMDARNTEHFTARTRDTDRVGFIAEWGRYGAPGRIASCALNDAAIALKWTAESMTGCNITGRIDVGTVGFGVLAKFSTDTPVNFEIIGNKSL
jgi:hypothetical protein